MPAAAHPAPPAEAFPPPDLAWLGKVARFFHQLSRVHRFEVRGLEHVPAQGRCLLVTSHSLATYDCYFLFSELYLRTGRPVRALAADWLYAVPGLREFTWSVGAVPARPESGRRLLESEQLVCVAPGGVYEALRPSTERYRLRWEGRLGFARLALETGAPLVLSTCPAADRLYTVYGNPLTELMYRRYRLPLPLMRGLGPTLLPRPVKLVAHLSAPLHPPPCGGAPSAEQVRAFQAELTARMQRHMAQALEAERTR